jgi:hypothetical protein
LGGTSIFGAKPMKFSTTTRTLRDLLREFHSGAILLPQFQRDYVWKPAKIRNLLDSLLKGYPIGGFFLWRPSSGVFDPKQKAFSNKRIDPEFVGYLIDGQQRLTSLEQIPLEFTDWNRGFSRKPPKGLTPEVVNRTGNRSRGRLWVIHGRR